MNNTLTQDFNGLYAEECKGKDMTISFDFIADAIMALAEAETIINVEGEYHGVKFEFIKLGIKGKEVFFLVFSHQKVSDELRRDLEEKTRFVKVGEMPGSKFCVDYSMNIDPCQYKKFNQLISCDQLIIQA